MMRLIDFLLEGKRPNMNAPKPEVKKVLLSDIAPKQKPNFSGKTMSQIIQEIHANFYGSEALILDYAKEESSLETTKQALIDKRDKLVSLGFNQTKEVKEADIEIARLQEIQDENKKKQHLVNAIHYFQFNYPQYKFITENMVDKLCEKYGLVHGNVHRYRGTVPDKNLEHMLKFKIKEEDECYVATNVRFGEQQNIGFFNKEGMEEYKEQNKSYGGGLVSTYTIHNKVPLSIVAPIKDFDMTRAEVKGYKVLDIPDPVVLCPVHFDGQRHYLIVTAWGDEASDEIVVNQKMN